MSVTGLKLNRLFFIFGLIIVDVFITIEIDLETGIQGIGYDFETVLGSFIIEAWRFRRLICSVQVGIYFVRLILCLIVGFIMFLSGLLLFFQSFENFSMQLEDLIKVLQFFCHYLKRGWQNYF